MKRRPKAPEIEKRAYCFHSITSRVSKYIYIFILHYSYHRSSADPLHRLNDGTATALATSGKGQPSSSGEGLAWAESSRAHQPGPQVSGPSGNTFRPGHSEEHARQSEEEFSSFVDGVDSLSSEP